MSDGRCELPPIVWTGFLRTYAHGFLSGLLLSFRACRAPSMVPGWGAAHNFAPESVLRGDLPRVPTCIAPFFTRNAPRPGCDVPDSGGVVRRCRTQHTAATPARPPPHRHTPADRSPRMSHSATAARRRR